MEVKKTHKADLNNKKVIFLEVGFIVSLLVTLGAFSWSSSAAQENTITADAVIQEEDDVMITEETPPEQQQQPIEIPVLTDQIDIVDDNVQVDDDMFQMEDFDDAIDIKEYTADEGPAEEEEEEEEAPIPFQLVEQKPSFNGGDANEFSKWVNQHLEYPEIAKENGVQGRVTLQFKVDAKGKVSDVKVLRGVDASLDKEAVRVVSMSPSWTPGKQRDRAVPVTYTFPVIFQLR